MQSKSSGAAAQVVRADAGHFRNWVFLLFGGAVVLGACGPAWSADDYLSELESEATKVEAREIEPTEGKVEVVAPPAHKARSAEAARSIDRAAFEELLKKHYLGTYRFYKKLSERSREEIFEQYRGGVEIGVIRNKIVTRLLQE